MSAGWLAFGVAVIGWAVTHVLTLRAHRKQFLNTVVDSARKDVVATIRSEQRWAATLVSSLMGLDMHLWQEANIPGIDHHTLWFDVASGIQTKLFADNHPARLTLALEEYENVFPQTATCRRDVAAMGRDFYEAVRHVMWSLTDAANRPAAIQHGNTDGVRLGMDLQAVLEDLRIHIQNHSLEKITGWKVQHRRVRDETLPRIIADRKGNLTLVRL